MLLKVRFTPQSTSSAPSFTYRGDGDTSEPGLDTETPPTYLKVISTPLAVIARVSTSRCSIGGGAHRPLGFLPSFIPRPSYGNPRPITTGRSISRHFQSKFHTDALNGWNSLFLSRVTSSGKILEHTTQRQRLRCLLAGIYIEGKTGKKAVMTSNESLEINESDSVIGLVVK